METNTQQQAFSLFNDADAAKILGLSKFTLRKMRSQGVGPAYRKMGRTVRYTLSDLQEYVASCAVAR